MTLVLFICIENSCRSQMAEGFAKVHGRGIVEAHSAGSRPSGRVDPRAVETMREIGYELAAHRSKSVDALPAREFDYVISMGCGDECPIVPARRREDWEIEDPKDLSLGGFRKVRDDIEARVRDLIERCSRSQDPA